MLADYITSMQAKSFSKMSGIELADVQIPGKCHHHSWVSAFSMLTDQTESSMADTTLWTGSRNLDQLVDFITKSESHCFWPYAISPEYRAVLPNLRTRMGQRSKSNGAPTLLFIAGAALRVADVTRVLKDKRLRGDKGGDVAKLFAKHFKLEEHVAYLKRTKIAAAVGTPGRLGKLLCDTGASHTCCAKQVLLTYVWPDALSTSALTHIILDVSYRDAKKRSLLDIPETRDEVFRTVLGAPKVFNGLKQGTIQLVLL